MALVKRILFSFYVLLLLFSLVVQNWALYIYIGYDCALQLWIVIRNHKDPKIGFSDRVGEQARKTERLAVVITERNERDVLPACIQAILDQSVPADSINVIDDGSTDDSIEIVRTRFAGVKVWARPHSGKAVSFNSVWPDIQADLILMLDADTVLEPSAIFEVKKAFSADPTLEVLAGGLASGNFAKPGRPVNFLMSYLLSRFHNFESMRAFVTRRAWARNGALLVAPGAFTTFSKSVLQIVHALDSTSLVEDYDVVLRIHRTAYEIGLPLKVGMMGQVLATTDSPRHFGSFLRQRSRWFGGFLQTYFRSWDMVGNGRYGAVGRGVLVAKGFDTLHPLFALVALAQVFATLAGLRPVSGLVSSILIAKLAWDLLFSQWCLVHYNNIHNRMPCAKDVLSVALLSVIEPFSFLVLRGIVAVKGWYFLLNQQHEWLLSAKKEGL